MFRSTRRRLACVGLLIFLSLIPKPSLATSTSHRGVSSAGAALSASTTDPDDVTGTDPEPIEPNIMSLIFMLLGI